MNKSKKGLGKGLNALIPEAIITDDENGLEVDIQEILPNKSQPRKEFDQGKLTELADSIAQHGVIQPILVSKIKEGYQIIAGERRWRAAMKAGIKKMPVIIKNLSDEEVMEVALIENLQREDLNDIEEAIAYKELMVKYKLTQNEISSRLGKSRVAVANTLRLLQLSPKIQELIKGEQLSAGHARAILSVDAERRDAFTKSITDNQLSVREAERLATQIKKGKEPGPKKAVKDPNQSYIVELEERVQSSIGTKVKIKYKNAKGKVEISYYSDDDLEKIIKKLTE